jgi:ATP-dependent helicase/nuclease subunit A
MTLVLEGIGDGKIRVSASAWLAEGHSGNSFEARQEELLRDQAEALRLAYVAATRACDLLVVPACGDRPLAGWLEVLNPALFPPDESKGHSEPVPGAPSFGKESVVDRGPQWLVGPERSGT